MIFVDTGAWFAANVPQDIDHAVARKFLADNHERLVTTDYVIDELLTLLRMRGERQRALLIGRSLFIEDVCQVEWTSKQDVLNAWNVFHS